MGNNEPFARTTSINRGTTRGGRKNDEVALRRASGGSSNGARERVAGLGRGVRRGEAARRGARAWHRVGAAGQGRGRRSGGPQRSPCPAASAFPPGRSGRPVS